MGNILSTAGVSPIAKDNNQSENSITEYQGSYAGAIPVPMCTMSTKLCDIHNTCKSVESLMHKHAPWH